MIENTSKRDPLVHLLGAMSDGTSDYITGMEADGQRQLLHSEQLPTEANPSAVDYEALGFTFGDVDDRDPLFRPATLPKGWKREGSDHAMWSYILDELGRRRVAVFYKAAFYDRRAFMRLETPGNYLWDLLYNGGAPVLDDVWLTADVAVRELEKIRADEQERAEQADGWAAAETKDGAHWAGRAAEHRAEVEKVNRMIAAVSDA